MVPMVDKLLSLFSVIQIILLMVIYSISLTFEDLISSSSTLSILQMGSLLFYFVEIVVNFLTVKFVAGKKITMIREIGLYYIHNNFLIDVTSFFILFLDITTKVDAISYLRLFIIFKLPQCLSKI